MNTIETIAAPQVGRFIALKTQRLARERGIYRTAKNLRKQGYPLAFALLLLVGRV